MNAQRATLLLRDVGSITIGLGGIVWQLITGPDPAVMAVLAGIASIPLANLGALKPSSGAETTPASSSPSPPSSGPEGSSAPLPPLSSGT